jgi:hypothetical protein
VAGKIIKTLDKIFYYFTPGWFYNQIKYLWIKWIMNKPQVKRLIRNNLVYKDIHKGQRCFILCNGPSVKNENLALLKGEIVMSVSQGYNHRDFDTISPKYHCLPQITYGSITKDDVIEYFKVMHTRIGNAELFLNETESELVDKYNLFPNRKVNYVCLSPFKFKDPYKKTEKGFPDITGIIPGVESVPVLCLMIALYMGFSKIYLLGVDHNFTDKKYEYAFNENIFKYKHKGVSVDNEIKDNNYHMFYTLTSLWEQYRYIKEMALLNDVDIYNLSPSSELDEFEKCSLEHVVSNTL